MINTYCRQLFTSVLFTSIITAAVMLYANTALAAQSKNAFTVSVNTKGADSPYKPIPNSAFCRSNTAPGSFGATIIVVCKTGAFVDIEATDNSVSRRPIHGGAYRFITRFSATSDYRDTISSGGIGTVSSWRTIHLHDRDYLELLIGW